MISEFLQTCRTYVHAVSESVTGDNARVQALFDVQYTLDLAVDSIPVARRFVVIQTKVGYGSCHYTEALPFIAGAVRLHLRDVDTDAFPREYRVAAIDAAAAALLPTRPDESHVLIGDVSAKLRRRSIIIAREVARLLAGSGGRVLLVGALGSLISELSQIPGASVIATDQDEAVIGRTVGDIRVLSGAETLLQLKTADVAVVTGMILANGSVDEILMHARLCPVRLVMYLQTGANLAMPYIGAGVDVVVSEPYPFYFVSPGPSTLSIFRRLGVPDHRFSEAATRCSQSRQSEG